MLTGLILKRAILLGIAVILGDSLAYAQLGESVAGKMKGFENIKKQVKSIGKIPGKAEDFPTWILTYQDELSADDELDVTVEPANAFEVIPIRKGKYEVKVLNPGELFSGTGELKDITLTATLTGKKPVTIGDKGEGLAKCTVKARFDASATDQALPLQEIWEKRKTNHARFTIEPAGQARWVGVNGTEAEFDRADPEIRVKVTFAFIDDKAGHEVLSSTDLAMCPGYDDDAHRPEVETEPSPASTRERKKQDVSAYEDKTDSARTETRIDISNSVRVEAPSPYEPNQYYSERASIPNLTDYRTGQAGHDGRMHYPIYHAAWVQNYGCCTGWWWARGNWWYGSHVTTWWCYYWVPAGVTP